MRGLLDALRCHLGVPRWTHTDPTGGDPAMGGPVLITVCVHCKTEKGAHP